MLPLRFAIVASLAAVCLWGLFSLLENLNKPELLRSSKMIVVKGCSPIETAEAAALCPQLLCQKAVLDLKLVPLRSTFTAMAVYRGDASARVVGHAGPPTAASPGRQHVPAQTFTCTLEGGRVTAARLIDKDELDDISTAPGDWSR